MSTLILRNVTVIITLILQLTCLTGSLFANDDQVIIHLPLDGQNRDIVDSNERKVGIHFPSNVADQDDLESTAPSRYRVSGLQGGAVRYFADDLSYSQIELKSMFTKPLSTIAIRVGIKIADPGKNRFASLVSCKSDSDTSGFALFIWGNQIRFCLGDGTNQYKTHASATSLFDDNWHMLEAMFDNGKATIWIDGNQVSNEKVTATHIAPPLRELFLGGYPLAGKGRQRYAFDGWLDDLLISRQRQEASQKIQLFTQPTILYSVQPIDGNESFFGGQKVFHTFHGQPVPLTFLFQRPADVPDQTTTAMVMYVPENIRVAMVHQSNHNEPGGIIHTRQSNVEMDGRKWVRHETYGLDLAKGDWKQGPAASWGFDADISVDEADIRYGLLIDGKEQVLTQATVRFLTALKPAENPGRFHVFGYFIMPSIAYPDKSLQQSMADLFKAIGFTGKGRFYENKGVRADFDLFLKDQGFTLYEIGLWHGPMPYKIAVDPGKTTEEYVKSVAGHLTPNGKNECVLFDYEPWRITYKEQSFEESIRQSFAQFAGLSDVPDKASILSQYKKQWMDFWIEQSARVYEAMSQAVRTHHPDPNAMRVAYTYFFPYDNEQDLYRRFWSVAKDPRKAEPYIDAHLISLYHVNDRELVDQIRLSRRHLTKPLWGISSVSRVNPVQSRYTTEQESLSPKRLEQKLVLCAALGMQRHGIWPGRGWIDGMHLKAIGQASQFIWAHESFYLDGQSDQTQLNVMPVGEVSRNDWAYTVHTDTRGQILATVFNFTDAQMNVTVNGNLVVIPAYGYDASILRTITE